MLSSDFKRGEMVKTKGFCHIIVVSVRIKRNIRRETAKYRLRVIHRPSYKTNRRTSASLGGLGR